MANDKSIQKVNKKSEGYAMLFIGSLMVSLSILIFTGNLYKEFEKKILIGVLGLVLGCLTIGVSMITIYKNKKYEKSVLYDFLLYDSEKIKNKLTLLKVTKENINVIKDYNVTLVVKLNHISYEAYIRKTKITFIADCEEEVYNSLSDVKKAYLDELIEEMSTLLISKEEVLDKFIKFIEKNKNKI